MGSRDGGGLSLEYDLRENLMLLATIVATVTYAAGFNPPGGVWQDATGGQPAGDPIIRATSYPRYLMFFYLNAAAFASSLVTIVLILILTLWPDREKTPKRKLITLYILRTVMVLDLLTLMGAYAAGTSKDTLTAGMYMLAVGVYVLVFHVVMSFVWKWKRKPAEGSKSFNQKTRELLMLLATFALSITYPAGLNAPGGFWDNNQRGHRPGDAVLKGRHDTRLKIFFACNNSTFVLSLLVIVLLLHNNLSKDNNRVLYHQLQAFVFFGILGVFCAYGAGSSRDNSTILYMVLLAVALFAFILLLGVLKHLWESSMAHMVKFLREKLDTICLKHLWESSMVKFLREKLETIRLWSTQCFCETSSGNNSQENKKSEAPILSRSQAIEKAQSLVELLATLAATITYQAGLDPPGGLWQEDGDVYKAGEPILLTRSPRRYKAFFYCNSVAFVASLVAIVLLKKKAIHGYHALEAAMILDLFGLIGAYAAGSCRDVSSSIYAIGLAGAVLVYVVIHIVFFTLDHEDSKENNDKEVSGIKDRLDNKSVETRRRRLLLFAIMAATLTYQAGLTPPSGFRLQDDETGTRAGDPVLLYNYPRRYKAFFYCNSVSFMLSISLIILLVNPNLYRPAIRSNALSVCTAVGTFGLVGAFAAGSTQHRKTSNYIMGLAAVVLALVLVLVVVFWVINGTNKANSAEEATAARLEGIMAAPSKDEKHETRKYLITLGSLAASVTYQAGLKPPGGTWPEDVSGHTAGNPIMQDNRRRQYLAFFYINFSSFMASGIVIILVLMKSLQEAKWWRPVIKTLLWLDLLGLLVAYAVGSSRSWKTAGYVLALVIAVLAYVGAHLLVLAFMRKRRNAAAKVAKDQIQSMLRSVRENNVPTSSA